MGIQDFDPDRVFSNALKSFAENGDEIQQRAFDSFIRKQNEIHNKRGCFGFLLKKPVVSENTLKKRRSRKQYFKSI